MLHSCFKWPSCGLSETIHGIYWILLAAHLFVLVRVLQVINTPLIPQTRRDYLNRDLDIYARFKLWVHLIEADQIIKRLCEVAVGEDRLVRVRVNVAEYLERRGIALFGDCQFAGFHGSLSPFLVDYGILMPCCGHFERI